MFRSIWCALENETQKMILIISPVVILGIIALLNIHPLVTIACTLLIGLYGGIFFVVNLIREFISNVRHKISSINDKE
ncbi:putative membrane protein [Priestia megaterium]|uniref:Putative membrane protein n=1 Tax=Priestia megaterium (strain ATCC 14581 / DSM 32 / CCUG 1817 / JCM 2506 / NBRC 15308 / NCIMB 9376 / NCTC 10342 / NRRL B-14308 / VKM B-512 / Ford 19) TaxID=1348623 RepID=A0A0B6AWS5_PRIM2|nr:putative membrane protein [Priestia megaterium NBRC 15308 = ATCC 14581]KFN08132.1 putative membrane protein [Priestia megaterium]KGJ80488.1 hypothetical protein BMT_19955 [Priestia megaterium NBRC 15308 = ATCC 14581]SUX82299.1 Uncharacterised protein [Priestia megaterium]